MHTKCACWPLWTIGCPQNQSFQPGSPQSFWIAFPAVPTQRTTACYMAWGPAQLEGSWLEKVVVSLTKFPQLQHCKRILNRAFAVLLIPLRWPLSCTIFWSLPYWLCLPLQAFMRKTGSSIVARIFMSSSPLAVKGAARLFWRTTSRLSTPCGTQNVLFAG